MTIAISQPTYLPWLGYFDLIDQSDTFVLLDSVQFEKQSWQQRNRIKTPSGLLWLTVPVVFRGRLEQRIHEVEIRDAGFWQKHVRAIELSYRRTPYFNRYFPQVAEILQSCGPGCLLADLNLRLIRWFCGILGIRTPLLRSSSMNEKGCRSEFLVNVCRCLRADVYLSPLGSANYLLEDIQRFSDAGIKVVFQHYQHPEYRQLFPPFYPYASALDLILNEGENSMAILRSGRKPSFKPEEVPCATGSLENG